MMNAIYGIRLTPLQGLDFYYTRFTGRCPVLLLIPFQGKIEKWIIKVNREFGAKKRKWRMD